MTKQKTHSNTLHNIKKHEFQNIYIFLNDLLFCVSEIALDHSLTQTTQII